LIRVIPAKGKQTNDKPPPRWGFIFIKKIKQQSLLAEIIKHRIKKNGPISFHDFMEMALYYPGLGYYTSSKEKIGTRGDFLTSPSMSSEFGALLGRQLEEMFYLLEEKEFTIVEYGAGPGNLCKSILEYLSRRGKIYNRTRYCIIEKSPAMIKLAKTRLPAKVQYYRSINEIRDIRGCILSNELVDNFAVHRVAMEKELKEVYVDFEDGFKEVLRPAPAKLVEHLNELKIELPHGFKGEINMQAAGWMKDLAERLVKGYVVTIDYGYHVSELLEAHRRNGTLTCYYKHRVSEHPYTYIGEQDITAHVNFSALCLWGYKHGLQYCGFTDQCHFLLSLGFYDYLKQTEMPGADHLNYKRERLLAGTLLKDMGHTFKVLVQHKNMDGANLMGLRLR